MVTDLGLLEVAAAPGSAHMILVMGNGPVNDIPTPSIEQRVAMAARVQSLDKARRAATRWVMPDKSQTGGLASPPISKSEVKGEDIVGELGKLNTNIYAGAVNAVLKSTAAPNAATSTGSSPARIEPPAVTASITIKPGESLLEAARRTLKEKSNG